jgi:hypothetical protein
MPLTAQEALDSAQRFIKTSRRDLPYLVGDVPVQQRFVGDAEPPRWEFYFEYQPPGSLLVDPSCARILIDSITGTASLFSPHDHRTA